MEKTIKLKDPKGSIIDGFLIYPKKPPWFLELTVPGEIKEKIEGNDLFDCFQKLRKIYKNYVFLCQGSRVDVYPSRMSRQMSGGIQAYIMTIGKQARKKDVVNIFDYSETNQFGTPEEQQLFFENWLATLQP